MPHEWWHTGDGGGGGSTGGDGWVFDPRQYDPRTRALQQIAALLRNYPGAEQIGDTLWVTPSGIVIELTRDENGQPTIKENGAEQSRAILKNLSETGGPGGTRLTSDDPRYWALQYAELEAQLKNMGLDAESARQQALATLIANRNNTALGVANTSLSAAEAAARFAANPRDAVAELLYRNQVGGTTPFGDLTNKNFGEYGKALAEKAASIFSPVQQDLGLARGYARSIPPVEFFGPEIRQQLGLPPTPAGALAAGGGGLPAAASPAAGTNTDLQGALQFINAVRADPRGQAGFAEDLKKWAAASNPVPLAKGGKVRSYAEGGQLDFGGIFDQRDREGFSPASSEGGTNLNIHERAIIVGESGQVYATLGEKRPDGSIRAEQLQIKPLKSEVEKDKKLQEANKAQVETQKKFLSSFQEGGTVNATPDDFMEQLNMLLQRLGGQHGGTGSAVTPQTSPLPSLRLLAGAPANALEDDPVLQDYALAGYSALGIDPRTVASTIRRFTPRGIQNNTARTSFA